jgi:hypothetical protein
MQKRKKKQIPEEILRMILLEKLLRERRRPRRRPIVVEVDLMMNIYLSQIKKNTKNLKESSNKTLKECKMIIKICKMP